MSNFKKRRLDKETIKEHVIKAATNAFCQKGIKNVRMDDLAMELSISKRTLYELFGDKEELLLEVLKAHREEMKRYMADVVDRADNVLEVILGFFTKTVQDFQVTNRLFFEDLKKYPKVMALEDSNRRENLESAMAFYQKGVDQGIFRDDVNYRIVQFMMSGQMNLMIQSEQFQYYSLDEIFETLVFMHIRGIATEKGLKIVNDFLARMKEE